MPEPTLTIDYNRYLYARANPLNLVDPSGHIAVCFQGSPSNDVGETGPLHNLCDKLGREGFFGGTDDLGRHARVFANNSDGKWAAWLWIKESLLRKPSEPVNLVGYSWGAAAALEFADFLALKEVDVENMILLDTVTRPPQQRVAVGNYSSDLSKNLGRWLWPSIQKNVKRAINVWATDEEKIGLLEGRSHIRGATNVALDGYHHASILDVNQPAWGTSASSASRWETKLNPDTLSVLREWLSEGENTTVP